MQVLKGHTNVVNSVTFSKDNRFIISSSDDRTIKIWDLENGKEAHTLKGHDKAVNSVVFSKNYQLIISGSTDKSIKIWDRE